MTRVAALIPVLRRPERVAPLVESFQTAHGADSASLMPLCSIGDADELAAWVALSIKPVLVSWPPGPGDWAKKINFGFRRARHFGFDWMLLGADDLRFHPGWFEAALAVHEATGACVIGTNDLANPKVQRGQHSTHPLVHRDYLDCGTIDEDGKIVHEGYHHQWVDAEFNETAMFRETWAFAHDSHVEHLHPMWGTAPMDATYEKALDPARAREDQALYHERRVMWT